MTTQKPPKNGPSPDIRAAAMNTYRATRAGINPGVLKAMKELISTGKIPGQPEEKENAESISRQKTYETVLKFMTLSKGSKEFMKQIAESLSKR